MPKVFAQSVRDAIALIYKPGGVGAHHIPNHARKTLLRNGLADIVDVDGKSVIVLTKVGLFAQELLLEAQGAMKICDRMRESAISSILPPIAHQGRAGAIGSHRKVGGERAGPTCGKLNTDSFAEFHASLTAAGKNRWKDPRYMGEGPARGVKPTGPGD